MNPKSIQTAVVEAAPAAKVAPSPKKSNPVEAKKPTQTTAVKPPIKKSPAKKPNASAVRAAFMATIKRQSRLDAYGAYCAGYARQMQQNDVADLIMLDCDCCPHIICAFALGMQHAASKSPLCNLSDLNAAVDAYTA